MSSRIQHLATGLALAAVARRPSMMMTRSHLQCSYMALSRFFRRQATLTSGNGTLALWHRQIATTACRHGAVHDTCPSDDAQDKSRRSSASVHSDQIDAVRAKSPRADLARRSKEDIQAHLSLFPESLRRLALSLPTSGIRRPTKEEQVSLCAPLRRHADVRLYLRVHRLLASTSSFLERLRIRFKWFTIRGFRRFRADDWSAFVSWVVGGVGVWVIVGTTSFFSAIFFLLNSLQMQEYIAASLGSYLTSQAGITIVFESAIVPRFAWRESKLTFKNVYVSRGMGSNIVTHALDDDEELASQPKANNAIQAAGQNLVGLNEQDDKRKVEVAKSGIVVAGCDDDTAAVVADTYNPANQYTNFHVSIDSIDITLSLPRWLDGKGLVREAVVKGVRGVIDRRHIVYSASTGEEDHRRFRHIAQPGDFHLEALDIEDLLVTVYQPGSFRPYTFSIFNASIPTLRKQWLFFDLMSANNIVGQVDNCLYSVHKPQSMSRTSDHDLQEGIWKRMSRFRIDGVPIDHLQSQQDRGPISWITSGKADLVADIRFPREPEDDVDLNTILGDIVDNLDDVLRPTETLQHDRIPGRPQLAKGKALEAPTARLRSMLGINVATPGEDEQRCVRIDLDIRFKDVKAVLPLFTDDLSTVRNALVRPIVAFINANKTLIPIRCHLDVDLAEFDGSWTTYDLDLLNTVSQQVYEALALHISDSNTRRVKTVGIWSLQKSAAAVLAALRQSLDHY